MVWVSGFACTCSGVVRTLTARAWKESKTTTTTTYHYYHYYYHYYGSVAAFFKFPFLYEPFTGFLMFFLEFPTTPDPKIMRSSKFDFDSERIKKPSFRDVKKPWKINKHLFQNRWKNDHALHWLKHSCESPPWIHFVRKKAQLRANASQLGAKMHPRPSNLEIFGPT